MARKYCGHHCAKAAEAKAKAVRSSSFPVCEVEGCNRASRSGKASYCEAHYYRLRRNKTLALKAETSPPPITCSHTHGYLLEYAPDHWLAVRGNRSRVYQHRRVFFDAHGEGPFNCHWCNSQVTWDDMDVDHVNAVRDDNKPSNLVASCHPCNTRRGIAKITATHRQRSEAKVAFKGENLTLGQWAQRIGISRTSLAWRLNNGWDVARALTEPRGVAGPR